MTSKRDNDKDGISTNLLFQNFIEQTPFTCQIHSLDGKLIDSNPAFAKLYGLSNKALAGLYAKYNILQDKQALRLGVMPYVESTFSGENVAIPEYRYDVNETLLELDIQNEGSSRC